SIASLIPTPKLRHILPALAFALQSPYPGWQNVVNSRNVMRNGGYVSWDNKSKIFFSRCYFNRNSSSNYRLCFN
ncbi:MAG: hypothetical protein LBI57_04915, partial [Helicobacteraceae bacterium]|nr:hypothetical protein [Helicobacteraceae bacterium]